MEPFDTILKYLDSDRRGTLATIISRIGAAPRDAGAKIFIGEDGEVFGSIGGGCVEAEVWQHARSVVRTSEPKRLRYSMSGRTVEDDGMICGGTVDLFLEPVTEKHKDLYEAIVDCLSGKGRAVIYTTTDGPEFKKSLVRESGEIIGDVSLPACFNTLREIAGNASSSIQGNVLIEKILPQSRLFIYGGGHISQHISRMAKAVDFRVTVIDDREFFANRERFPEADEIIIREFKDIQHMRPLSHDYAVIVTRGHKHDAVVLKEILKKPPHYTGMIGSKRKVKILFDDLREKGFSEDVLRGVHAPIGIDIGAETPQEIAVSIVAELIKIRSAAV